MNRRVFLHQSAFITAALTASKLKASDSRPLLGMDHFSLRATGWKAGQYIDHAASLKLDTCFISELHIFESFEEAYLKGLKEQADKAGLKLYVGTGSVCGSSNTWKDLYGTPEEHLALTIRIAKALGSPVARCYLGNQKDRATDGGIQKHIEATIKVIQANKSRAEAEGIKIAIENHAGDMQSHELKALIETAGKSYVGANIDPGNAVWAMEEPMAHLEALGPLTICSSVRDSMVWDTEDGAVVQWTAVGEGLVDFKAYAKRLAELAPGVPLQVETISGFARPMLYKNNEDFWKAYPGYRDTAAFKGWVDMSKKGKEIPTFKAPDGAGKKDAEIAYQKAELQRSIEWLQANL
ncbi:sugar phosphate isomerase/epimerase [Prosthecobacter fusiformis]|uniref:Sugar phosphate isomerase/epimerase n=1 Tax=Prosthecobacter fusiformis TaxID=48464 RepID=A0A4R7SQV7_9BACT|nr:TIM barrel protein [Prosthecobacter fusiformis]TDU81630.1 sugar phosphate isomerase/epimerase [Prosthecobacter fusiformis]